jgi:hypothetical protein
MATILELARHADVTPETVLRVILREPASEIAKRRVAAAVAELGPPDYPRPQGNIDVLPAEREPARDGLPVQAEPAPEALDDAVLARVRELVEPAAGEVVQLRSLFGELVAGMDAARRERVEDLELVTELVIEGWRGVDSRLTKIEATLARLEESQAAGGQQRPFGVEDGIKQPFSAPSSNRPVREASET